MLEFLNLPEWVINLWAVYGEIITPVLITLALAIITSIALSIKSSAKVNAAKADLQIQALKEVANREDNKPQLQEQSKQLSELKQTIILLSDIINLSFQNANIDPEIKASLSAISNKIKYGSEDNIINVLEQEKQDLNKALEEANTKLNTIGVIAPKTIETRQRKRR